MEQEKIPHPFPLAPSTAKGIPRLRHGARWASGVHLALCGGEAAAAAAHETPDCSSGGGGRRRARFRPPAFGLWPGARPRVFPGWQTAPGGGQVAVWPCAGAVEAGVSLPVEAPGARAQRGSWASCAPQPLASGPKHGQGCSQAGRRRQVGVRWRFGLVRGMWGRGGGSGGARDARLQQRRRRKKKSSISG